MLQRKELTVIIVNVIITKMVLMFPKEIISNSGNAAWIQTLYNIAAAFLLFFIISKLYRGKKNVIELAGMCGGKLLKIIVGLVVFASLIVNYASIIRVFPETIKIVLLQDFNVEFITVIFMAAIGVGAYIGIQSLARVNYLFMPVIGGVFVLFLLCLIPYYNVYNLLPILGNGAGKIFGSGFNTLSLFSDVLLLNIFLPYYENNSEAKKSGQRALIISSVIILAILLSYCLIYPYPVSEEFMIPIYQLARIINLGSFFSQFEAIFQFAWSVMLLLYSAVYVYALCYVWQITFGLKFYKPVIFPATIISGAIALLPDSIVQLVINEKLENIIVYPIAFLLPVVFGVVSRKYYGTGKDRKIEKA